MLGAGVFKTNGNKLICSNPETAEPGNGYGSCFPGLWERKAVVSSLSLDWKGKTFICRSTWPEEGTSIPESRGHIGLRGARPRPLFIQLLFLVRKCRLWVSIHPRVGLWAPRNPVLLRCLLNHHPYVTGDRVLPCSLGKPTFALISWLECFSAVVAPLCACRTGSVYMHGSWWHLATPPPEINSRNPCLLSHRQKELGSDPPWPRANGRRGAGGQRPCSRGAQPCSGCPGCLFWDHLRSPTAINLPFDLGSFQKWRSPFVLFHRLPHDTHTFRFVIKFIVSMTFTVGPWAHRSLRPWKSETPLWSQVIFHLPCFLVSVS